VSPTAYGHAQRSATGFDQKRLHMLLAVLEKRAGLRLGVQDVFLNMTGGMRVEDPAMDLAICMALVSAYKGFSLPATVCFFAEVGLSGELRPVHRLEQRIGEAKRLGFDKMYIAKQKTSSKVENKTVFSAYFLEEVIEAIV
jgi:DNA repair protein RadA/Sms